MQIKTKHLLLSALALLVLANGEKLKASAELQAEKTQNRIAADRVSTLQKEQAREAVRQSAVALERAKSCIGVVESKSQRQAYFTEGASIVTGKGATLPLSDGRIICNDLGDTAIAQGGRITNIAKAAAADMEEYQKIRKGEPDASK